MNRYFRPVLAASLSIAFVSGSLFSMATAAMPWRKTPVSQPQAATTMDQSNTPSPSANPPVSDMRPMDRMGSMDNMSMQDHDGDGVPGHMENMTPEQKKAWQVKKAKWDKMTPTQRKQALEAREAERKARYNALTPEQRQQFAQQQTARMQARLNTMTPEQRQRFLDKKAKWDAMTPEQRAQKMAEHKAKWDAMTPEQRQQKMMSHDDDGAFMPPPMSPDGMPPRMMGQDDPAMSSNGAQPHPMAMPK